MFVFQKVKVALIFFLPGAVPVGSKAAELKFWTKNDGQVSYQKTRILKGLHNGDFTDFWSKLFQN